MSKKSQLVGDFAYAMGVTDERERIIKLLEGLEAVGSHPLTSDYLDTDKLIAFIKGENK